MYIYIYILLLFLCFLKQLLLVATFVFILSRTKTDEGPAGWGHALLVRKFIPLAFYWWSLCRMWYHTWCPAYVYICAHICTYIRIYIYTYEMLSYTRLLVNTPAARSLPFTHSPDVFSFTPLWFWTLSFGPGQHRWNLRWLAPLRYNLNLDNRSSATWAKRGDKEAPEEWLTQDLATLKNVTEPGNLQRRRNLDGFDVWKEAKPRFKFARKAVEEHTNDLMQRVLDY